MRKFLALLIVPCAALAGTTWTVTQPKWISSVSGKAYATNAQCVAALENNGPGTYKCTATGAVTIIGTGSSPAPGPTPTPPSSPPPPSNVTWVYHDGVFSWGGDWSFEASINYQDTSGVPESGSYDIAVKITGQWGGFQPFAPVFNDSGDTYLVFDLKPTVANQDWQVQFEVAGDVPVGSPIDVLAYGPQPVAGRWATYKIPLSVLGVQNSKSVYKFFIQDETGRSSNLFYVDNIGFE